MPLKAFGINCTLKPSSAKEASSTDKLLRDLMAELERHDVDGDFVRALDYDIKPGVLSNMGKGDDWPTLRQRIIEADIFILGSPIWLGQPSSIAKRVLERMDAFLGETDAAGRMPAFDKIALVAIVGNEDGAHHCHAACFQALNDVGFTIPANAGLYWVGEAMGKTNYIDLPDTPETVADAIAMTASNAAHLAMSLKTNPFPGLREG